MSPRLLILCLLGATASCLPVSPSGAVMDCTTAQGADALVLNNMFPGQIKVRTCADAINCVGNPLKPNHYNDCPERLLPSSSVQVSIDANSTYLVFASTDKSFEYWKPATGWPAQYDVNMPAPLQAATAQQFYLPDDPNPDRSEHCNDVDANITDSKAAEWWSANSYKYADWTSGLCPAAKYNTTNQDYHPVDGGAQVTLRRMGRG
eukprot:TRINITY_DN8218_c0_g1_i4.p1 TRINITY_DN8218_c0_g1~~TRINITY_DN8218_c0_g1_i4.p1  ORF type:complete len:206 (-),score=46.74 TRINITY_DN8218_c0_g1_i4:256-873(-)